MNIYKVSQRPLGWVRSWVKRLYLPGDTSLGLPQCNRRLMNFTRQLNTITTEDSADAEGPRDAPAH